MTRKEIAAEIFTLMQANGFTFKDLIEEYVEQEGIIGVGLISMKDGFNEIMEGILGGKRIGRKI